MPIQIDINLLPPEFRPAPPVRWTPPYLAFLYSLGLFLILWFIFHSMAQMTAKRDEIADVERSISMLKPFEEAYDASQQAVSMLENVKVLLSYLDYYYVDWPVFLNRLQPHVPSQIWLTSVAADVLQTGQVKGKGAKKETVMLEHEGKILIDGNVNGYPLLPIATFLNNLRQDDYFIDPRLEKTLLKEQESSVSRDFGLITRVTKLGGTSDESEGESNNQGAAGS